MCFCAVLKAWAASVGHGKVGGKIGESSRRIADVDLDLLFTIYDWRVVLGDAAFLNHNS